MKKLLAIAATLAASSAFAGVKLEVRSDYVNTPNYDNNAGSEVAGTSVFTPAVARLYLSGNVGDAQIDSGWNLRAFSPELSGTAPTQTLSKTMTVDSFVDHLWIAKSMGDWTFKAGKLEVNTGGFEHAKVVHGDTYLTSLAAGGAGGKKSTSATVGTVTSPANSSGVSAAYTVTPEHKLEFQVTNSTNSQTLESGDLSTDKRHNMGLAYMGSFLNKMIQANVSYIIGSGDTVSNTGLGTTTNHEQNFLSAGLRFLPMENLTLDVDYLANSDKTDAGKAETNSTILEARYAMGMYTPVFKYEMSTDKDSTGADNFKRDAWALALEVAPKADEAFRYHVAYASVKDKDFSSGDDVTQNVITVGIKYVGDIVK